jgi:hypothetical protein
VAVELSKKIHIFKKNAHLLGTRKSCCFEYPTSLPQETFIKRMVLCDDDAGAIQNKPNQKNIHVAAEASL